MKATITESEKKEIATLVSIIKEKTKWKTDDTWRNRDFITLSDMIFENTGTKISVTTFRRIFDLDLKALPNITTLDAMANYIGHQNWVGFLRSQSKEKEDKIEASKETENLPSPTNKKPYIFFSVLVLLIMSILFFVRDKEPTETKEAEIDRVSISSTDISFECSNPIGESPHELKFNYDISKLQEVPNADALIEIKGMGFDSAFTIKLIEKGYDNSFYSFVFDYPGIYNTYLNINENHYHKQIFINQTEGWELLKYEENKYMNSYSNKALCEKGVFKMDKQKYEKLGLDAFYPNSRFMFIDSAFMVTDPENFEIQFDVKAEKSIESDICSRMYFSVLGSDTYIGFGMTSKGCSSTNYFNIPGNYARGNTTNMEKWTFKNEEWHRISLSCINDTITISSNGEVIIESISKESLGTIGGMAMRFFGNITVDHFKFVSGDGKEVIYEDEF